MWRLFAIVALVSNVFCQSVDEGQKNTLQLGPIQIGLTKTLISKIEKPLPTEFFLSDLKYKLDDKTDTLELKDKNVIDALAYIRKEKPDLTPQVRQKASIPTMEIVPRAPGGRLTIVEGGEQEAVFKLKLAVPSELPVRVRFQDGSISHLDAQHDVRLDETQSKMVVVSVGDDDSNLCTEVVTKDCYNEYLLFRTSGGELVLGAFMEDFRSAKTHSPALRLTEVLAKEKDFFVINGRTWIEPDGPLLFEASQDAWRIQRYPKMDACRAYSKDDFQYSGAVIQPPRERSTSQRPNGITVGDAKIFDVATLTRMLNDTAAQLASIAGFNATPITAAYGNLQGVVRDTSYLNVQATTAPTLGASQTLSSAVTTPNTVSTTSPIGATTVTLQCPDGSLPTIGSSNTLGGCAAVPVTGSTANVPAYSTVTPNSGAFQGVLTTTPAGTTTTNTGTTTTNQNGTTITTPSVSGVAPAALTSTAPPLPTNVGYGSADILAEQVQINSQLTTYRLLLQGNLSDQYLLRNSRAVAVRQQTTVGFAITLDPPRQFKHAVAEVRISIVAPTGQGKVSIVNLLPSEKTYNVAKVSSRQNAFGAGAVIEPVSIGVSTGKSKDRLYLAKDTDTIALQYPAGTQTIQRPLPQFAHDAAKSIEEFQILGECPVTDADKERGESPDVVQFGWQFRPVLGADYVRGGQRQVFAQIALPAGLEDQYAPTVWVETRWRAYDPTRQVVGATYSSSCTREKDLSGIVFANQPRIRDVELSDLGAGQVKLTAKGDFYSSSLSIRAGSVNLAPTFFDGTKIELIGSAHDLFEAGDLSIIGPNGQPHAFGVPVFPAKADACRLVSAEATAIPRPDGNSHVDFIVNIGGGYDPDPRKDGSLKPFIMIGNQIYGLKETPFLESGCAGAVCKFAFLAPTTALRNAQSFIVKDLAWQHMEITGRVKFAPSYTSMTLLNPVKPEPADKSVKPAPADKSLDLFYTIAGFDIPKAPACSKEDEGKSGSYCLKIYAGVDQQLQAGFAPVSDNTATLKASSADLTSIKKLRFVLRSGPEPKDATEWDLDVTLPKSADSKTGTPVASPAYLATGDSRKVVFTGPDFSDVDHVTFDGTIILPATFNAETKSLEVMVSTAVTGKPGHKEFTAAMKTPNAKALQLSIDVFRQ